MSEDELYQVLTNVLRDEFDFVSSKTLRNVVAAIKKVNLFIHHGAFLEVQEVELRDTSADFDTYFVWTDHVPYED